jgi:large subunit ribosomal protein L25
MVRASTNLQVSSRNPEGSRAARRLRRTGRVPGVLYGGGGDPLSFDVDARELRLALAAAGAVLDLSVDGARATPVVLKDAQRDAVRGHTVHVDLLRVNLDTAISAVVPLELTGADDAPGAREGGVLEQITRELNVEALPNDIPEAITHDVSELQINDTVMLEALSVPAGVTLLDDPETVIATLTPPRLQAELEEIEAETALVGEEAARAEGESEAEADASEGEAPAAGESTDGGGAEA